MHTSGHTSIRPQSIPWIRCGRPFPLEPHRSLHRVAASLIPGRIPRGRPVTGHVGHQVGKRRLKATSVATSSALVTGLQPASS
jgi:hypothetical protein